MKRKFLISNATLAASTRQVMDNKDWLVIPVVALVEGVLNNAFYSRDTIAEFPDAWNGVPISVNHPQIDGNFVSANTPVFEETVNIGKLFNVNYGDGKLSGEIWIEIEKAKRLGFNSIIDSFDAGEPMEVSTGLFADFNPATGTFNDKGYSNTVANMRPDHLALLPNTTGACSIADGCGALRANSDEPCCDSCAGVKSIAIRNRATTALAEAGLSTHVLANENSHNETWRKLSTALDAMRLEGDDWPWIMDIYDDYIIYEFKSVLYKRGYAEIDDAIVLSEIMTQVVKKTSYEVVNNPSTNADNLEVQMDKETMIAALIANAGNKYVEGDRARLEALDDDLLQSLTANADGAAPAAGDAPDGGDTSGQQAAPVTNGLSDDEMATFRKLKANEDARIAALRVNALKHNSKMTEAMIANFDADTLEAMIPDAPQGNFAGRPGSPIANDSDDYKQPSILTGNGLIQKEA